MIPRRWIQMGCALLALFTYFASPKTAPAQGTNILKSNTSIKVLPDDTLSDFVIDHGDFFGAPATRAELDRAIADRTTYRTSGFFERRFTFFKPYFGEIPTSLCYRESSGDHGVQRVNPLQIRKNFEWVDAALQTPEKPAVFLVAAGFADAAQQALYYQNPPLAYGHEQYWAVVFAGATYSNPTAFVVDRIKVGPQSTEILLDRPPIGGATSDMHPYWFFIPLGRLVDGEYAVNVRSANTGDLICTSTAKLRRATKEEEAARNKSSLEEQQQVTKHYDSKRRVDREHGAELQLRQERLAEFVHSADLPENDRKLLASDVEALGKAVDSSLNIFHLPRYNRRELAPPTPGITPGLVDRRNPWDDLPKWQPSNIALKDIWLCDGTDAGWFVAATYRNVAEFNGALTAETPTPIQDKIRRIWLTLAEKYQVKENRDIHVIAAAGSITDAIDTAFNVFVEGQPNRKLFSPDDNIWIVFVARSSFLLREVSTRHSQEKYSKTKRSEFLIHSSAYIGHTDGMDENSGSPVTLALIPLGQQKTVDSVGVSPICISVCSRQVSFKKGNSEQPGLLEAVPPEGLYNEFRQYLGGPTGFKIDR